MRLDNIGFVARPRQPWEAVDLGLGMARRWWWPLMLVWLALALPVGLLAWMLSMPAEWIPFLLWWLKPLFERPQLYLLSRLVFGERLRLSEVLRQLPRLLWPQCIASLTWRRLSPSRSYDLPPLLLEGLSGAARKRRLKTLHGAQYGQACWLTIIGAHIETLLYFSLSLLVAVMMPDGEFGDWLDLLTENEFWSFLTYLAAMAVVAPFYVAGGFGLYLNRRTHLEAWDIELAFRRMAQRLQGSAMALLLPALLSGLLLTAILPAPAQASNLDAPADMTLEASGEAMTPEQARALIGEVLNGGEFIERHTIRYPTLDLDLDWEWTDSPEMSGTGLFEWLPGIARFLAASFEVLAWSLVGVAVILVLIRYRGWISTLGLPSRTSRPEAASRPEWFNLAPGSRTWPQQLTEEVLRLWRAGEFQAALGLLYGASLDRLVTQGGLVLKPGATEGDCLRLVRSRYDQALAHFFTRLTGAWLYLAYGCGRPSETDLIRLCQEWDRFFGPTGHVREPGPNSGPMAKDAARPESSRSTGAKGDGGAP